MNNSTNTREGCGKWLADTLLIVVLLVVLAAFVLGGGLTVIAPLPGG